MVKNIKKVLSVYHSLYTDDNADELTIDPAFKAVLGKSNLASQPTLSRFNLRLYMDTVK